MSSAECEYLHTENNACGRGPKNLSGRGPKNLKVVQGVLAAKNANARGRGPENLSGRGPEYLNDCSILLLSAVFVQGFLVVMEICAPVPAGAGCSGAFFHTYAVGNGCVRVL